MIKFKLVDEKCKDDESEREYNWDFLILFGNMVKEEWIIVFGGTCHTMRMRTASSFP